MISARAIVAQGFAPVEAFYKMFSTDTTKSDCIGIEPAKVERLQIHSLRDLMMSLRSHALQHDRNFLLCLHSGPSNLGYSFAPGAESMAGAELLKMLASAADGNEDDRTRLLGANEAGRKVFKDEKALATYLGLVRDVRQAGLKHLEFRGCQLGSGQGLQAVKAFFKAERVVAPTGYLMFDTVSTASCINSSEELAALLNRAGPQRRAFTRNDCNLPSTASGNGESLAVIIAGRINLEAQTQSPLAIAAVSYEALQSWCTKYLANSGNCRSLKLSCGGGYQSGRNLPLMAFFRPNDPECPFVFPGEPAYRDSLKEA